MSDSKTSKKIIVYKKVNDLIPYINNARTHNEDQINQIIASINEYGFTNPILIDENNNIIAGHGRLLASKKMKLKEVPCIVLEGLTDAQKKAYTLADNKMALNAGWDEDLLKLELENLQELDLDMDLTGFSFEEIDDLLDDEIFEEEIIEDEIPEPPKVAKSKPGQIYQLGVHRLMCGDSTNPEDVAKLMNNQKADLLLTDPPYNVNISNSEGLTIQNDNMANNEFKEFLEKAFNIAYKNLKDGASFYVWYASREVVNFHTAIQNSGLSVKQELIWNKNALVMGRQDYQWKHEPCLYGWKETESHNWYSDRTQTTVIDWDKPSKNDLHPTMKPVGLFDYQIQNSSKKNDLVLDLFGGSGTTLIACEQNDRKCCMMELDPIYVDVIIERWENLTGDTAVLIEEGEK